jgi:ribosomal-protein-alanine N-acetyltransferase
MLLPFFTRKEAQSFNIPKGRVYLRPPLARDFADWARVRKQSKAFLIPWEPTWAHDALTRASYRRRLRHYVGEWRQGAGYAFFIFTREGERLVGGITLSNVRRGVAQAASVGYWIDEAHARQGYMTEALLAVCEFSFSRIGLRRLEAACLPQNEASRGLLEKVGFQYEGYAREYLRIDGEWRDHLLYALLRDDPRGSRKPLESGAGGA